MSQPPIPPPGQPNATDGGPLAEEERATEIGLLPVRFLLVLVSLLLLWFMDLTLEAWRARFSMEFRFPLGLWLLFVLLGVLAGAAFGLALALPLKSGYRWGVVAAVGTLPLILLLVAIFLFARQLFDVPEFLLRLTPFLGGGIQSVAAVMLGVALAAGIAGPRR